MKCKTCRYWARDRLLDENKNPILSVGSCEAIPFKNGPHPGHATVIDFEDYDAILVTDQDFGCILHKAKDQEGLLRSAGPGPKVGRFRYRPHLSQYSGYLKAARERYVRYIKSK